MPRAKKVPIVEAPARQAPIAVAPAEVNPSEDNLKQVTVDVDAFVRLRDSVVTGLATLQDAISSISSAYIKHTNAVLGEHGVGIDIDAALSKLGDHPLLGNFGNLGASAADNVPAGDVKKEKKKRVHDPNAPKRPLTPYFLYMQTARPIIAEDLGPEVAKGAVSTEGVRRWNVMAPSDKALWTSAYTDNLKLYNARMHSYKNGNANAKEMPDEEAMMYAETNNIGVDQNITAEGQLAAEAMLDAPGEDDDEALQAAAAASTPRTPAKKGGRKQKGKSAAADPVLAPGADLGSIGMNLIGMNNTGAIIPPGSGARGMPPQQLMGGEYQVGIGMGMGGQPMGVPQTSTPASAASNKRKRASKKGADEPVASIEMENVSQTPATAAGGKQPRKKKGKVDA